MIDKETWISLLLDVVSEFESESYQNKAWVSGQGKDVSSWDEALCKFFDDYDVDGFINKYFGGNEFDDDKKTCFLNFRDSLSEYSDAQEDLPSPKKILADPNWVKVRKLASIVLEKWKKNNE